MNLEKEVRRDYEISTQMKKVWAIQIEMVQKLLDVCKRNNLKIWADGGTLLGAVREHGYIPWDDDIDMLMFRGDYDKLLSIATREFKSPFFFQSYKTDKNYFRGHSQLRYEGTTCILQGEEFCDFHQGVFIDIFVYDSIPDILDSEWEWRVKRADTIMWLLFDYSHRHAILNPSYLAKRLYHYIYLKILNPLKLYEECENLFRYYKFEDNSRVFCPMFNRNILKTAVKQKEWYASTIYMPFEDFEMPVPCGYHHVLTTQYGNNYMIPQKSPTMHGEYTVLDTEKSYEDYILELRKGCWEQWRNTKVKKWANRLKSLKHAIINKRK